MPENEQRNNDESTEQEQETEVEETEDTDTSEDERSEEDNAEEQDGDGEEKPKEAPKPKPPAFDAKRAEAKIRKANSEAANLRKRLKELEPLAQEAQKVRDANKTETERLQGQLEAAEKRIASMRDRAVKSEVRSMAAELFADKTDAEAYLTLADYVTEDGEIDTDQIEADLAELLERKPHLGKPKPESERKRPAPDKTQASSANGKRTSIDPAEEFAGIIQSRLGRR
jgi:hypothetical protein